MLDKSKPDTFKSFVKPAIEIKNIKLKWNDKLKQHENNGFNKKGTYKKNQLITFMECYPESEEKKTKNA